MKFVYTLFLITAFPVHGQMDSIPPGGVLHENRCVPGHNDFQVTTESTREACFARCPDLPECKTVDYVGGRCYPSKAGYGSSQPYANCDMWVKSSQPEPESEPEPDTRTVDDPATPKKGSGSGDPHFKTWTGHKYDYHGECDLVLVDNPTFDNGKGLKIHIQTTRVKYFSYIEKVAIQIGTDVLVFSNDVKSFLINGKKVEEQRKRHMTYLDRFVVRRDMKAISIRLSEHKQNGPKIDLIQRNNGFPAVIVDGGSTDMFKGSLGLLGEWSTGKRIARDGKTEMNQEDATAFAEEWQVRDTEPMLFESARAPQFPAACVRPDKMAVSRLGMTKMQNEAEKACAHWKEDMEDCIFDVIATRDILVAEEGHLEQHLQ